ncbi:MAG TPA: hypothetical protein VG028_13280 [Terriglobia bacterium]|nr:hypothetical protein [Terriglobia bacterium]
MPEKSKLIVISDHRFEGEHIERGTMLEIDLENPIEARKLAPLLAANRLALATPDVVRQIMAEKKRDAEREKAAAAKD